MYFQRNTTDLKKNIHKYSLIKKGIESVETMFLKQFGLSL